MAISFTGLSATPITLETFVDEMRAHDTTTVEGIAEAAGLFAALNANRRLLTDHVLQLLRALRDNDTGNEYTGQTFLLHTEPGWFVRANVWLPAGYGSMRAASESDQFFYGVPHDHNFTFMTAGHFGAGYSTSIFEYDGISENHRAGDRVATTFLEDTTLPQGKLIVFRASRDIHTQYAPDEFSISLNLMTTNQHELVRRQQLFNADCTMIVSQPRGEEEARQSVFAMAALIGDDRTEALLHDLVERGDASLKQPAQAVLDRMARRS